VNTRITTKADGKFVEAFINQDQDGMPAANGSLFPLGITPDRDRAVGTFFFAVGQADMVDNPTINRIGLATLPRDKEKARKDRDHDDCDHDGKSNAVDDDDDDDGTKDIDDDDDDDDGIYDWLDDDEDNDGIKNDYDTRDRKESQERTSYDLSAGQSADTPVTVPAGALLLIATATASNPLALVSVDILNPAGAVVASSVPTPGLAVITAIPAGAGEYTVRVKNQSLSASEVESTAITRELLP
jgi:hypothetical protein